MTAQSTLQRDDLRFINLVAVRRFAGREQAAEPRELDAALESLADSTPYARAAHLARELLSRQVFADEPLPTALLAMVAQLERDGLQLLAPQGVVVGMLRELAGGEVTFETVARWLEDRAVPSSSQG